MEQLETRTVYDNAWMTVREDRVARSDGTTGTYGVVDKADFALTMPREQGGFWLVQQYRYPIGRRAWEFPQGSWAADASGDQAALALAELREETGVFLATHLVAGPPKREHTEQDMVHRFVTDVELATMIGTGEIVDAASVAADALFGLRGSAPTPGAERRTN